MSLSEHQDQISADKLSNNMEVIPPISLTYATAVVLSERIPICNDFLWVKNVERNKVSALKNSFGNFESIVFINEDSKNEINWWISNLKSANGKFIRHYQKNFLKQKLYFSPNSYSVKVQKSLHKRHAQ
jgi:hypothetical protein